MKMVSESEMRKTLEETLGEAEWVLLAKHAERDALILLAPGIGLLEAGMKIAQDDTAVVSGWIQSGKISKPTKEQMAAWNADPTRKFFSIVVQPYVLIQEAVH
jgi:hypothetical protein